MENPTLGFGLLNVRKSGICRLCMKAHEYYLNIFVSNEVFNTSISKAIEDLLVLKVAKDDNLPKMVCCPCVTKLMEFREFKEMCMNSAREFGRHAPVEPIKCPVKDEFLPMPLLGVATSGTWSNCVDGESGVHITPNDLSLNPYDLENPSDTKEVYLRDPLGESYKGEEEDFAETESNEDASVFSESKQILMDAQGEVKEEPESTELVGNVEIHSREVIDEGDSSDTGGPILLSDILAVMGMRYAEEDSRPTELIVKEEIGEGLECSENDVPVLSISSVNVDPLAADTTVCKIKDEDAADVETSREGSSQENTFPNDIHLTEVYITTPDDLAIGNVSHAKEELWSTENTLVVKEEVNDGEHRIEGDVPVNALTSVAVDPLAVDMMAVKEDAEEPKVAAGQGNSLGDTSPHNHIRVTEVFVPIPDELAMGPVRYTEEDSRPTELIVKEEIGEGLECSENDVPVVSLSSVNVDPLAMDTTVDRCNNIGRLTEELEKEFGKFEADRQGISQDKLLNDPSFDPVCEENLQLEYSMANQFLADCFPERMVKKQGKNVAFCTSRKEFSQANVRARPVRNHECEQFCHQSENTSYPTDFICNYCSTRYSQKNSLARHIKRHVIGKKSAIVLPKKEFPPRFSQYLLQKDRGNVEPVIAETSNMSFTQKSSRRKNEKPAVEESSRGENLGRELCNIGTLFFKSVNPHEKAAFVCDTCGIEFMKKCDLVKHVNVHNGLIPCRYQQKGKVTLTYFKPLRCDLCGKYFKNTKTLKIHSVTHTGKKSFKCDECGKMFTTSGNLKTHSVIHTGVKKFKCNECGKMFTHSSNLKCHSVLHTGVKTFKCYECGKMFNQKDNLKTHSLVHTSVRPFICNECGKMFSSSSNLKKHSVVHTGVKSFKCNECGKMFSRSSDLRTHSVVHTGVRPFKCNECGKMFTTSSNLKCHSVIHTGVKPFKCDFCGKKFKWRAGFKRHLLTHADRNPLK